MDVKVKICGITNLEDALVAKAAGADYLGFIFYPPSKRAITVDAARDVVHELRRSQNCPLLVGVFVNETAATIAHILQDCRLDLAQLSGDEVPSMVADRQSILFGRAYTGHPTSISKRKQRLRRRWYAVPDRPDHLPSLLVDSFHPTLRGGTGETGDWTTECLNWRSNSRG